jgi:protein-S-isoprenylcysteine O-methyltransferase Ste14
MSPMVTYAITVEEVLTEHALDHPKVAVFPPLIPVATILLGAGLQWLAPISLPGISAPGWRWAMGALLLTGIVMPILGFRAMRRHGTNVTPFAPSTALVTDGIFGWSRNPFYTGGTLAMLGLAVLLGLDWVLILAIPSILALHLGVIRPEEIYLENKFGALYRRYKASVPRYVWPL